MDPFIEKKLEKLLKIHSFWLKLGTFFINEC